MTKPITSTNYAGETMTLVDAVTLQPISEGEVRLASRHEDYVVRGGRAPHKPESTGKVWVSRTPFAMFAQSMLSVRLSAGQPHYSAAELERCWGELSRDEQAEWAAHETIEFYPSVIDAKWHARSPLDDHAEAPTTITRINHARRLARRAALAKRRPF